MIIVPKYNILFFFEDDAEYLCKTNLSHFYTPNRFHVFQENALDEFVENYYSYLCGSHTDYNKLFTEGKVFPKTTGLKYAIWIDKAGKMRNTSHNDPRIKVYIDRKDNPYPVCFKHDKNNNTIYIPKGVESKELKRVFNEICAFILLNKDILIKLWDCEIDFDDAVQQLISINKKSK